jgi:hypothetical protein
MRAESKRKKGFEEMRRDAMMKNANPRCFSKLMNWFGARHTHTRHASEGEGMLQAYSENSFSKRDTNPTGLSADHRLLREELDPREFMRRSLL